MEDHRETIVIVAGSILAFLLQIVLAPAVAISFAMPNFPLAFAIAYACVAPRSTSPLVVAFVLGLLYNLICGGVVGGLAFVLPLVAFIGSALMRMLDHENVFVAIACIMACVFAAEILYGIIALLAGTQGGIVDALIFRALPCALYDSVFGIVFYFIMRRLVNPVGPQANSKSIEPLRFR